MAKPVINIGAYGDGRSAAAAEGVKEAITGVESDLDKAAVRKKAWKEEQDKLDKEEAAQEDENWEATQIKDDPADVLKGELEDGLREMKTELGTLDLKTPEGRARKREIYAAYADVNKGLSSVSTLLQEYRTAMGPGGTGMDGSTPNRVRKILIALDKNPGAFNLVYKDGMMRIVGEANGESVNEPMGAYLSNLRFSPKKNWDTTINGLLLNLKGTTTNYQNADGSTGTRTTYDPKQREAAVNQLLGGTKSDLLSLANRYGISAEEIAEKNLSDDDLRKQLRPLLDQELKREDTSTQTKAAASTATTFSDVEKSGYGDLQQQIYTAATGGDPSKFGNIDPTKLAYFDVDADGEPLEDGQYILAPIGKDRKAHTERVFGPGDIASATDYAQSLLLDDKGRYYFKKQRAAATAKRQATLIQERRLRDPVLLELPEVQTGAKRPPKGKTPREKAIYQIWEENNFDK